MYSKTFRMDGADGCRNGTYTALPDMMRFGSELEERTDTRCREGRTLCITHNTPGEQILSH